MSEYNMSHTGQELDEAIRKVKEGYVLPTEEININSNVSNMDITNGKTLNVNVPNTSPAFVTEVVYPLSSETNYTGVEVPVAEDNDFVYIKVADEVYTQEQLRGKQMGTHHFDNGESEYFYLDDFWNISENGSFCKWDYLVVVNAEDVGKHLVMDELSAIFPESGTYLRHWINNVYLDVLISGTYKREFEPQDFGMIVEGELDPETFSVISLNREYQEIAEALRLKKDVRLLLNVPLGDDGSVSVLGTVETFRPPQGMIEFGAILDTTLNPDDGEQVYHFLITLWEDESVSTVYKVLGEQDNRLNMKIILNWDTLTAGFPSIEGAWDELSFQDIYQAFAQNKDIVTRIGWDENGDDDLYRGVYTSDFAYYSDALAEGRKQQFIISAILNIDVRDGSGKQDYYFKFILNEDNTVTTEYQLIGGGSGSQEADLVIEMYHDWRTESSLHPDSLTIDWEKAELTHNLVRSNKIVRIFLKGYYQFDSGDPCPIQTEAFSIVDGGNYLYIYFYLPPGVYNTHSIACIQLETAYKIVDSDIWNLAITN